MQRPGSESSQLFPLLPLGTEEQIHTWIDAYIHTYIHTHIQIARYMAQPIAVLNDSEFTNTRIHACVRSLIHIYRDLQRRHMFWKSKCQHIWIIVMCSIRVNCVSFILASQLPSILALVHFTCLLHASRVCDCIRLHTHVHAHIEGLHVYERITSFAEMSV
jgi:hypothetical protein